MIVQRLKAERSKRDCTPRAFRTVALPQKFWFLVGNKGTYQIGLYSLISYYEPASKPPKSQASIFMGLRRDPGKPILLACSLVMMLGGYALIHWGNIGMP